MSLSVTRARVKEKCGIADSSSDSAIDNLIAEMVPAIEFSVSPEFVADTSNTGLQALLNLGALELVCGEFLDQLLRPPGTSEGLSMFGLTLSPAPPSGIGAQGAARLAPYLKDAPESRSASRVRVGPKAEEAWP